MQMCVQNCIPMKSQIDTIYKLFLLSRPRGHTGQCLPPWCLAFLSAAILWEPLWWPFLSRSADLLLFLCPWAFLSRSRVFPLCPCPWAFLSRVLPLLWPWCLPLLSSSASRVSRSRAKTNSKGAFKMDYIFTSLIIEVHLEAPIMAGVTVVAGLVIISLATPGHHIANCNEDKTSIQWLEHSSLNCQISYLHSLLFVKTCNQCPHPYRLRLRATRNVFWDFEFDQNKYLKTLFNTQTNKE